MDISKISNNGFGFGKLHIRQDKTTREFINNKAQYGSMHDPDELMGFKAALNTIDTISGNADVYMRYDKNMHLLKFSLDNYDDEVRDIAEVECPYRPTTTSAEKYYRRIVNSFKCQFENVPEHTKEVDDILNIFA